METLAYIILMIGFGFMSIGAAFYTVTMALVELRDRQALRKVTKENSTDWREIAETWEEMYMTLSGDITEKENI